MNHRPFVAAALLGLQGGRIQFKAPVQLCMIPEYQAPPRFALRLHQATSLHFDFRLEILGTLLSFVSLNQPSLDPARWVLLRLVGDHDLRYLGSERRIPEGQYGAGPTMPVDLGVYAPIVKTYTTYELEILDQLAKGDLRFTLNGTHLRGGWQLRWRNGDSWDLRKLDDEHASTTRILKLDRSVNSGKTLDEI